MTEVSTGLFGKSGNPAYALHIARSSGALLFDKTGRDYCDLFGSAGIVSIGHNHPAITEALRCATGNAFAGGYWSESRDRVINHLFDSLPESLRQVAFFSSGTEAVEAAYKIIKARFNEGIVLCFTGAFHGRANLALAMSDSIHSPGLCSFDSFLRLPYPGNENDMRWDLLHQCSDHRRIIGCIVEPIQGSAGNIQPYPGFYQDLRDYTRKIDACLIADEIITGCGRTGSLSMMIERGVVPDVLLLGKGLGNGVPVSALLTTEELASSAHCQSSSSMSSSFGGNALSMAAADAVLTTFRRENILPSVQEREGWWIRHLQCEMESADSVVESVSGVGMLARVKLRDKVLRSQNLASVFLQEGVIVGMSGGSIRLSPPLNISNDVLNEGIRRIAQALKKSVA